MFCFFSDTFFFCIPQAPNHNQKLLQYQTKCHASKKPKKKATKKNENYPRFYLVHDKTKQLIDNMLNNQKQHKSHKKVHTEKNKTEKNKTNEYLTCSEIDFLLESSSQSNSNDSDDSPNTQHCHNLNLKKK